MLEVVLLVYSRVLGAHRPAELAATQSRPAEPGIRHFGCAGGGFAAECLLHAGCRLRIQASARNLPRNQETVSTERARRGGQSLGGQSCSKKRQGEQGERGKESKEKEARRARRDELLGIRSKNS